MINGKEHDQWDADGRVVVDIEAPEPASSRKLVVGERNGVFVAITCKSKIYKDYNDPKMTAVYKNTAVPLCLMMQRWDGRVGFPGGFVDVNLSGKTEEEALEILEREARRELEEETGLNDHQAKFEFVRSDKVKDGLMVHLFHFHLDYEPSVDDLRDSMALAVEAKDFVTEGNAFWAHIYGKGLENLLKANTLASCVREELEAIVERIKS